MNPILIYVTWMEYTHIKMGDKLFQPSYGWWSANRRWWDTHATTLIPRNSPNSLSSMGLVPS